MSPTNEKETTNECLPFAVSFHSLFCCCRFRPLLHLAFRATMSSFAEPDFGLPDRSHDASGEVHRAAEHVVPFDLHRPNITRASVISWQNAPPRVASGPVP